LHCTMVVNPRRDCRFGRPGEAGMSRETRRTTTGQGKTTRRPDKMTIPTKGRRRTTSALRRPFLKVPERTHSRPIATPHPNSRGGFLSPLREGGIAREAVRRRSTILDEVHTGRGFRPGWKPETGAHGTGVPSTHARPSACGLGQVSGHQQIVRFKNRLARERGEVVVLIVELAVDIGEEIVELLLRQGAW